MGKLRKEISCFIKENAMDRWCRLSISMQHYAVVAMQWKQMCNLPEFAILETFVEDWSIASKIGD